MKVKAVQLCENGDIVDKYNLYVYAHDLSSFFNLVRGVMFEYFPQDDKQSIFQIEGWILRDLMEGFEDQVNVEVVEFA